MNASPGSQTSTRFFARVLGPVLVGLLLVALPKVFVSVADSMIGAQAWWVTLCLVFAPIGLYLVLYLAYVGRRPVPQQPISQPRSATADPPRAA